MFTRSPRELVHHLETEPTIRDLKLNVNANSYSILRPSTPSERAGWYKCAEPLLPSLPSRAHSAAQDDSREYEAPLRACVSSSPDLRAASFSNSYLLFPPH